MSLRNIPLLGPYTKVCAEISQRRDCQHKQSMVSLVRHRTSVHGRIVRYVDVRAKLERSPR